MSEYRVGTGFDAHALEGGVPLVLGGVRIDHPRGLAGHSDGDVLAHALTDALLGAAGLEDIGALFPSGDPELAGADSLQLLAQAWERIQARGWGLANADVILIGEEPRIAPHRDEMRRRLAAALDVDPELVAVRATTTDGLGFTGRGEGLAAQAVALLVRSIARRAGDSTYGYGPGPPGLGAWRRRRQPFAERGSAARERKAASGVRLALVTHAEHPKLRGTLPDFWPEFMSHDPVVQSFWPQLYDQYPDFQLWVVDREAGRRATVGYACSVPVGWKGRPSPRGIDWALTDGVEGTPTTLCAIVAGVVPEYRGFGVAETILRRLAAIGAGHGLDALVAPVRPTWKDRYPLVALDRYAGWRRADGLPYDPWLRTHERLGGELLAMAPRSMTISGTRADWEEWTGMVFPEDGNYVVPGALVPVHFKNGRGVYVEPNVWVRHAF